MHPCGPPLMQPSSLPLRTRDVPLMHHPKATLVLPSQTAAYHLLLLLRTHDLQLKVFRPKCHVKQVSRVVPLYVENMHSAIKNACNLM